MIINDNVQSKVVIGRRLASIGLCLFLGAGVFPAQAQDAEPVSSKYYSVSTVPLADGSSIDETVISGPPEPPPGFEAQRQSVELPEPDAAGAVKTLTAPAYNWVFGCSAVSAAMIAGYWDRNGYPNMYTGPTAGGVMPLTNSSWPTWTDSVGHVYPNLPLAASKNGVDGRTIRGSIDDYWIAYGSTANDPYITGGWTQHAWGTAVGDYMKTSQSAYGNSDGSTTFYNWTSLATPLTCADMVTNSIHTKDGTYGRKLFYEARGYTVTDCYNQKTDNTITGGFSFAQFKAQIDANRPVFLNLAGHSVVGVGYDTATNLVYIHDTWDYNNHTMTWGGSYSGMALQSVSIVNLASVSGPAQLYATFTGGTYKWDGTTWKNITSLIPQKSVVIGTDLYASFTSGLYKWSGTGTTWTRLQATPATAMVKVGSNLHVSFAGLGTYKLTGTAWTRLTSAVATTMAATDTVAYMSFSTGTYRWTGTAWTRLTSAPATGIMVD